MTIIPIDYAVHLKQMLKLFSESLKNPKGSEWFEWKHIRNPFGKSVGYIAEENGEVLGVRLFMRWQFQCNGTIVKALRPVDTVTRPQARGKGIFTALTLKALEDYQKEYDVIFNTPNQNSLPGYLKMGWRLPDQLFRHFYIFASPFKRSIHAHIEGKFTGSSNIEYHTTKDVCQTFITDEFLRWRYEADRYHFARHENSILVFEKIRKKGIPIIIVKDFVGKNSFFKTLIHATASRLNAPLILCTNNYGFDFNKPRMTLPGGRSVVAFRGPDPCTDVKWDFSLGDLEGIL
jgi:GNAT superfamily N-acetyltransferase